MQVKIFSKIDDELVHELYKMFALLEDANELKRVVFTISYFIIRENQGRFFIGYDKGEKVSYGLLSNGIEDPKFRRLKYFAVIKEHRGEGLGVKTLKEVISQEIDMISGFGLTCNKSLEMFYAKAGFKYIMHVEDTKRFGGDEIVMNLNSPITNISRINYGQFFDIEINEDEGVASFYKEIKSNYGIDLLSF